MSIHCMICGQSDNWVNGKETNFDDTVRLDVVDEFNDKKKNKKWSRYVHARCILRILKKNCKESIEYEELNESDDFFEIKKMIEDYKKQEGELK